MTKENLESANILYSEIHVIEKLLELLTRNNNHDYLIIKYEFRTKNCSNNHIHIIEDQGCVNNLKIEAINFYECKLFAIKTEFHSL